MHVAAHGHHEAGNPLFSGVKLADGLLFGYDFAPNPTLPGHVVLSSCDVGQTDDRPGGEPLGLVAALVRSGVPTVVTGTSRIADCRRRVDDAGYHQRLLDGERAGRGAGRRGGHMHAWQRDCPLRSVASARVCDRLDDRDGRGSRMLGPARMPVGRRMLQRGDRQGAKSPRPPAGRRPGPGRLRSPRPPACGWLPARSSNCLPSPSSPIRQGRTGPRGQASQLRARILITMADAQVELGRIDRRPQRLLDEALGPRPVGAADRAVVPRRAASAGPGRLDRSLEELDAAVPGLSARQARRATWSAHCSGGGCCT